MAQQQMSQEQLQALQEKIRDMSPEELKEFQKKQCIFCQMIEGKAQSRKICEDSICYGILDINPANPGHALLMTKEHYSIMPQIPDDEVAHVFAVARNLSNTILRSLEAEGTNIIAANGVAAGQRAQHFMVHIIPRKANDGVEFQLPQRQMQQEEIDEIGDKIANALNSLFGIGQKVQEKPQPAAPQKIIEAEFREEAAKKKQPKIEKPAAKPAPGKKQEKKEDFNEASSGIDLDDIAKLLGGG